MASIATTMSMDELPEEIISMIFSHLKQPEISNLRLACKKLARIGDEQLVSSLHMTFRPKSFKNLRSICSSDLTSYVKRLVYEADVLPRVDPPTWFEQALFSNDLPAPPRCSCLGDQTPDIYDTHRAECKRRTEHDQAALNHINNEERLIEAAYRAYRKEVYMIGLATTNNDDFTTVDHALKKFPKIESVEMILGGRSEVGEKSSQSTTIHAAFQDVLIPPHALLRQKPGPFSRISVDMNAEMVQDRMDYGVRQLKSVLLAIASSDAKLKDLRCGPFDYSFFEKGKPKEDGNDNFAEAPELYLPAFANLVTLELAIDHRKWLRDIENDGLRKVLSAAKNLKNLKLILCDSQRCRKEPSHFPWPRLNTNLQLFVRDSSPCSWDWVASDSTWQHLEELTLVNFAVSEQFFNGFLTRHAKTLRKLHFENIYLTPSPDRSHRGRCRKWPRFFSILKDRIDDLVKLEDITFAGSLYSERRNDIREYQLSVGGYVKFRDQITRFLLGNGENPFEMKDYKSCS